MIKKSSTGFNNMYVTSFSWCIKFRCMGRCCEMRYTMGIEKGFKFYKFSSIVRVKRNDGKIKIVFNNIFECRK